MSNDVIFEISKYLEKKTGIKKLDEAFDSPELLKCKINFSSNSLEKKLNSRPTLEDLMNKNIIRIESTDFDYIHTILETINFRENSNRRS